MNCWCRKCKKIYQKNYQQTEKGKERQRKSSTQYRQQHPEKIREYRQTLVGHLRRMLQRMKQRCESPKHDSYKYYGGRGIKLKFTSDEFVDYVTNDMSIKDIKQIKGLQIDRINNNGHYERGNIRFVTAKANSNNRE